MKCKRDPDGRKRDRVQLKTMRDQAVKAMRNGETAQSVANAYQNHRLSCRTPK